MYLVKAAHGYVSYAGCDDDGELKITITDNRKSAKFWDKRQLEGAKAVAYLIEGEVYELVLHRV